VNGSKDKLLNILVTRSTLGQTTNTFYV